HHPKGSSACPQTQVEDVSTTNTLPSTSIIQKVHQFPPNLKCRMCSVLPIGNGCWQVEGPAGAPFPECCPSVQCAGGLPNGGGGGYNVFY
ncbi:unnamed protein product, partial [Timema podura]|nr:unnamed protein product [Timema podura]